MKKLFKKSVLDLAGYRSPPQRNARVKLNQNESPFDLPASLKQEILEMAAHTNWNRYPVNESPLLRSKLARLHDLSPDQILLGNGSNQLLETIFSATVNKETAVLSCPPSFSLFHLMTVIHEGKAIDVFRKPGEDFPKDQVMTTISQMQPELILLCSPNNPTGAEIAINDIRQICELSEGLVIVDEAYGEFSQQSFLPLIKECDNLIISRTFSKAFSLAGLRFGYLAGQEQLIDQLRKTNLPYNINLFTELVVSTLLENMDFVNKNVRYLIRERDWLYNEMAQLNEIQVYRSAANFLLFKVWDGKAVFNQLKSLGVLVRDVGSYPLLSDHLRVNAGTREENRVFLDALQNVLKATVIQEMKI